jgi:hypothetical protein
MHSESKLYLLPSILTQTDDPASFSVNTADIPTHIRETEVNLSLHFPDQTLISAAYAISEFPRAVMAHDTNKGM